MRKKSYYCQPSFIDPSSIRTLGFLTVILLAGMRSIFFNWAAPWLVSATVGIFLCERFAKSKYHEFLLLIIVPCLLVAIIMGIPFLLNEPSEIFSIGFYMILISMVSVGPVAISVVALTGASRIIARVFGVPGLGVSFNT